MNLCVIPARGGSKRIPRKNIREFCGKPIIAWSIDAALESGVFDRVVVSTDDDEIAAVAVAHGAEVPFRRPANLSDDFTGTIPVVGHAVEWSRSEGLRPRMVCCIYATAPFVSVDDLRKGPAALVSSASGYAVSVTRYEFPIQRAVRLTTDNLMEMYDTTYYQKRSQDLDEAWHDAGQFYWGTAKAWLTNSNLFQGSAPIILPRHRVQDIDTEDDWARAELMFRASVPA
jgi:N-acylneuraminate cytidylyltransferase